MKPTDEQKQTLIDKYLEGRLSEQEQQDFQEQIQDADFEAEVRFQEGLDDAVQDLAKAEHPLKKLFQAEEKKIKDGTLGEGKALPHFKKKKPRPQPTIGRYFMMRAAGLAILALVVYQLWPFLFPSFPNTSDFPTAAIKSLERPPQMTQITKSGEDQTTDSLAINCITYYKSEDQFPIALSCFQDLNKRQTTPEIRYYTAQCFFNLEDYESAIPIYDELLASTTIHDDQIQDQIRWNRLLSLVLIQETGYKEELQNMIQDKDFKYLREAQKLRELLDRYL